MRLAYSLALPRDALSVPLVRRILTESLETFGATRECVEDMRVAISEACTNVLDHAVDGDDYEVIVAVDGRQCSIEVVDRGHGFDGTSFSTTAAVDDETGRGIRLMHSLVDSVTFEPREKGGTVVCLVKELEWRNDSPLRRLATPGGSAEHR